MASTSPLFLMWIKTNRCLIRMTDPTTLKRKKCQAHPIIQNCVLLLSAKMHNLFLAWILYMNTTLSLEWYVPVM